MKLELIRRAVYFSAEKHNGQYRKGVHVPYFAHSVLVTLCVAGYYQDDEIIAAAVLHDVLEDCPDVTALELRKMFGRRISKIVHEITAPNKKHKTWRRKKEVYLNKIKKASRKALVIVAADKIANMYGYIEYITRDKQRKRHKNLFGGSLADYLWYYKSILSILESRIGSYDILKEYRKVVLRLNSLKIK